MSPTYEEKCTKNPFQNLKTATIPPILMYPDSNKPYFIFTGASYNPDNLKNLKPITFISGKVSKIQCNYAALVREAFAIYVCQKT